MTGPAPAPRAEDPTGRGNKRATSADVAKRAGVSRATVSYVLNDRPDQSIPESTRRRVLQAARALSYVPNASARALRGKFPPVILLVNTAMPFGRNVGELTDILTRHAAESGYSVVSFQSGDAAALAATIAHLQPQLIQSSMPLAADALATIAGSGIPHVDGWSRLHDADGLSVMCRLQVDRLLAAGCRRIAYLGAADSDLAVFARDREQAVRELVLAARLPEPPVSTQPMMVSTEQLMPLRAVLREWRSGADPVDGVACYNDFWAGALLRAARAEGIDVPGELSVIGLDDEPMAAFLDPPLTTVALDVASYARDVFDAAQAVIEAGLSEASAVRISHQAHAVLIERESAAPPRVG